jgi:hypothetical protein
MGNTIINTIAEAMEIIPIMDMENISTNAIRGDKDFQTTNSLFPYNFLPL